MLQAQHWALPQHILKSTERLPLTSTAVRLSDVGWLSWPRFSAAENSHPLLNNSTIWVPAPPIHLYFSSYVLHILKASRICQLGPSFSEWTFCLNTLHIKNNLLSINHKRFSEKAHLSWNYVSEDVKNLCSFLFLLLCTWEVYRIVRLETLEGFCFP